MLSGFVAQSHIPLGGVTIIWANMRGVDALFTPQSLMVTDGGIPGSTATALSQMKNLGFNFIRVPLSWTAYASNSSKFNNTLTDVLDNADANGISVVLDYHQIIGWDAWPSSMLTAYNAWGGAQPGYDNMLADWWNNRATYTWQNMMDQFWKPIIQLADSHPSVVGYEIMNEPPLVSGMTVSDMQRHNQFFANAIRSLTSKAIVFMDAYNCAGCGDAGYVSQVAPTGVSNLVYDLHTYSVSDPSDSFAAAKSAANSAGVSNIFVGEWGPSSDCGWPSQATEQSTINLYYAAFKQYGFGNAYWIWRYDTDPGDGCVLVDANNNPNWIAIMLSQAAEGSGLSSQSSTIVATTSTSTSTTTVSSAITSSTTSSTTTLPALTSETSVVTPTTTATNTLTTTLATTTPPSDSAVGWVVAITSGVILVSVVILLTMKSRIRGRLQAKSMSPSNQVPMHD